MLYILVFSLKDRKSFNGLTTFIEEIKRRGSANPVVLLLGNKSDLFEKRKVTWEIAKEFADMNNMIYIETSVKTGHGIQLALNVAAQMLVTKIKHIPTKYLEANGIIHYSMISLFQLDNYSQEKYHNIR